MKLTDDQLEAIAKEAFPYRINEESDVTHADMRKVALAVAAQVRQEDGSRHYLQTEIFRLEGQISVLKRKLAEANADIESHLKILQEAQLWIGGQK